MTTKITQVKITTTKRQSRQQDTYTIPVELTSTQKEHLEKQAQARDMSLHDYVNIGVMKAMLEAEEEVARSYPTDESEDYMCEDSWMCFIHDVTKLSGVPGLLREVIDKMMEWYVPRLAQLDHMLEEVESAACVLEQVCSKMDALAPCDKLEFTRPKMEVGLVSLENGHIATLMQYAPNVGDITRFNKPFATTASEVMDAILFRALTQLQARYNSIV